MQDVIEIRLDIGQSHPHRNFCDILHPPNSQTPRRQTSTDGNCIYDTPSPKFLGTASCAALNSRDSTSRSRLCTDHAACIDKENVSPHFLDSKVHPEAVQELELASTLPQLAPTPVVIPNQFNSIIPSGLPPIQTHLPMTLRGKSINFDLQTLDDDPRSIIQLLSATLSDRDKWMVVGAVYRRKGNVYAALTVVITMVKVLYDLGLRERDLKPAFLMLSSCHVELWRQSRGADGSETETSAAHLDKSCRWLQLVYGQNNPETPSENCFEILRSFSLVDTTSRSAHGVPSVQVHIISDKSQRTDIDRDLQVLRDRQALHVEELAHAREAKRRLEDEAANERVVRRRLERTLRDLETKLAKAQRRADDAHVLVRMEANTRRRCEQTIAEERAKCRVLEEHVKKQAQGTRPLLEGLAGLFQSESILLKDDTFIFPAPEASPRR
ncbi:hypothetical protein F5148DRAFT_1282665 [Russula earlei]|uniref:Uncharacterized protein n=1 Tax=Russula earlei TaxID=71964 RepID=A0ACC0UDT2_9AGAM|nr:hypothetical protein F5148DRAFT_1282665 [Russula earlei]